MFCSALLYRAILQYSHLSVESHRKLTMPAMLSAFQNDRPTDQPHY